MNKRFIEESFPTKEVSILSAHEKEIRRGHISGLHIWWARRPLASSRATAYAALVPAPESEEDEKATLKFIIDFAKWENSINQGFIEAARRDVFAANGGAPPRILDPFAGGGAIPLEALRLGCETYSSELNPVAVLIEKATLCYPQKYANESESGLGALATYPLVEEVERWATKVFESAREELKSFFPEDEDGSFPVGYFWARTISCQNPSCGAEIPLVRQYWLARTSKKKISLFPYTEGGSVKFKIVGGDYGDFPKNFNPGKGTVAKAIATCLVCGSTVDAKTTRRLFRDGKSDQRMIAVVLHKLGSKGKRYRVATLEDSATYALADAHLRDKEIRLLNKWGIEPVPNEPLPPKETLGFRVQNYGMLKWGDLFNSRQKLALITLIERTKAAHQIMIAEGYDREYAKTIATYLALIASRCSDYESNTVRWLSQVENPSNTFARQAIPMSWDYFELNLFSTILQGTFESMLSQIERSLLGVVNTSSAQAIVSQASATSLPYPNDFFDAVFTDPPYYDNVPYSYLSDFFYVWLKRALADLHPDLFSTPLTPKKNEIVAYSNRSDLENGKEFFESMLKKAFQEIHRVLKPNGIAIVVYAHKSTEGWETLINSLLDSSLVVTASLPLNTERRARLRGNESAAIASSVYIVVRKRERQKIAFYNEVKEQLRQHLNGRLDHLWTGQTEPLDPDVKKLLGRKDDATDLFSGADFFIAAIGSAIEVFGKYEKVIDYEGNSIRADKLLDDAQEIVTDYVVNQILHNGFGGEITGLTRFYVLWRWNYGEAKVPFDDARKLAQSCGIDLTQEWGKGRIIQKEGQFIRVLGPHMREKDALENSLELIDVLHRACLLWGAGKSGEMLTLLSDSGFGNKEVFYRVAQAISETLPNDRKEKQLLEGFLAGKEHIKRDIKKGSEPATLSDWS